MLHDEIERIWEHSTKKEGVNFNKSEIFADLNAQLKSFDRSIKNRDQRENIAAFIVIILFGAGTIYFDGLLSKIGMIIGVIYGVLVIWVLKKAKKQKPTSYELPTTEYLLKYHQYLLKERSLLNNIIFWYLLPPFISCLIFFIDEDLEVTIFAIKILIVLGLYIFIYFLNKLGIKKTLNPLIEKLDKTIKELDASN